MFLFVKYSGAPTIISEQPSPFTSPADETLIPYKDPCLFVEPSKSSPSNFIMYGESYPPHTEASVSVGSFTNPFAPFVKNT